MYSALIPGPDDTLRPLRLLVTGAGGFIGAALTRRLVVGGHEVVAVENGIRGTTRRIADLVSSQGALRIVEGDVCDPAVASHAAKGCSIIFHLAAVNGTENFYKRPDVVLEVGIRGALATMDAAIEQRATVQRYVCFSSSEIYNEPTHVPTGEDERAIIPDLRNPRFSYGGGKIASELLAFHYLQRRGVPAIVVRPHNVYGPDMGDEHVIPQLIKKIGEAAQAAGVALGSGGKVGIDIQGDGSETRAFCYVEDFIDGLLVATARGGDGEIFHIGTEEEVSVRALVEAIGVEMGVTVEVRPGPRTEGSTTRRCPATGKLRALGYAPRFDLPRGLKHTVRWYRKAYGL